MTERQLRRLIASLVKATGTMGVLVGGGCSASSLEPGPSSAGTSSAGMEHGNPSSSGGTGVVGGQPSASGGVDPAGGKAGVGVGGVMGCTGAECSPAAGTASCQSTGGNGACAPTSCGGSGGAGGSCACVEPAPGPCTVPKDLVETAPFWQGAIPSSCLPNESPLTEAICRELCGFPACSSSPPGACNIVETDAETATIYCRPYVGVGRRPPGLIDPDPCLNAGEYFANASMLEAASVVAFRVLERDLVGLKAPRRLLRGVRRAARDEVRHARATRNLARRFGARSLPVRTTSTPQRSLLQIAINNATEGCIRETFGALAATYQATTATDSEVRAVMSRIAREETRHAALSWQIARWLEARLCRAERKQVAHAMLAATHDIRYELERQPSSHRALGLPSSRASLDLLRGLESHLPGVRRSQ